MASDGGFLGPGDAYTDMVLFSSLTGMLPFATDYKSEWPSKLASMVTILPVNILSYLSDVPDSSLSFKVSIRSGIVKSRLV